MPFPDFPALPLSFISAADSLPRVPCGVLCYFLSLSADAIVLFTFLLRWKAGGRRGARSERK
ncbi:MAG: hypothetical protein A2Y33_09410 [Spirochaetes bacterium GWF1_51_8]|nr:MAG: hypothetical protein A2Y33_09410 [Spirochaetes bacterium GWF1_51_8]